MKRINFQAQFVACRAEGLHSTGDFVSYAEHPEMLPAWPKPDFVAAVKSGEMKGFHKINCGRFPGTHCWGGNVECRKMRGVPERKASDHTQ